MGGRPLNHTFCCFCPVSFFFFFHSQTVETVQPLPRPSPRPRPLPAIQESFSQASPHVKEFYNQIQEVSQQNRPLSVHGAILRPPSGGGARKCDRWPCQPRRNQVSDGCHLHCPAVLLLVHTQHSYVPLGRSRSVLTPKGLLLFFSPLAKCFSASLMLITIQLKWNMVPQRKT